MMKKKTINTTLPVHGLDGKVVGNIQLDADLFDGRINMTLLYEANRMYEANARQGTVSVKTRSEVSGGGIKPWRQKGTGRARVGSIRNPLWRHGGVAFGPQMRDYSYRMPKKALQGALLSGLNARLGEEMIKAVVKIELKEHKTKAFKAIIDNLKLAGKTLVIVDNASDIVKRSARNLEGVSVKDAAKVNVRDILLNENIVIEKEAVGKLTERLK